MTPAPIFLDAARRARRLRQLASDTAPVTSTDPAVLAGRAAGLLALAFQSPPGGIQPTTRERLAAISAELADLAAQMRAGGRG